MPGFDLSAKTTWLQVAFSQNVRVDVKLGSAKPRWDVKAQTLHVIAKGKVKLQPSVSTNLGSR